MDVLRVRVMVMVVMVGMMMMMESSLQTWSQKPEAPAVSDHRYTTTGSHAATAAAVVVAATSVDTLRKKDCHTNTNRRRLPSGLLIIWRRKTSVLPADRADRYASAMT